MEQNINNQTQNSITPQAVAPTGNKENTKMNSYNKNSSCTCSSVIIIILILIVFILFGKSIFNFFHFESLYYFLLYSLIEVSIYIISLILVIFFIRYPQDLLSLLFDRARQ